VNRLSTVACTFRMLGWLAALSVGTPLLLPSVSAAQAMTERRGFVRSITVRVPPDQSYFFPTVSFEMESATGSRVYPCDYNGTSITYAEISWLSVAVVWQQYLLGAYLSRREVRVTSYGISTSFGCVVEKVVLGDD